MFVEIPFQSLSPDTLQAVLEEFVTREGTDYGHHEHSLPEKTQAVLRQLQRGDVAIVFDPKSETCSILTKDQLAGLQNSSEA